MAKYTFDSVTIEFDFVTSLLADPTQLIEVDHITPQMLEDSRLRQIYEHIRTNKGKVVKSTLLQDLLATSSGQQAMASFAKEFQVDDPRQAIDELWRHGLTAGSAAILGEEIISNATSRWMQQAIATTHVEQFPSPVDYGQAIITKLNNVLTRAAPSTDYAALADGVDEALAQWDFRLDNPGKITGIRINLGEYDKLTGGLKGGQLIIIAGHSGEGKSQFMCHAAIEASRTQADMLGRTARVAYVSLEMSKRELSERFIGKLARVDLSDEFATPEERQRAYDQGLVLKQLMQDGNLVLLEPHHASTLDQINRELIRLKQTFDIDIAFVDYAQLIKVGGGESKYSEMATIAQTLKSLAMQLDIPIVLGAQLNRKALEETGSARPRLYHIADGMDLVRSADLVHMIWTPGKHLIGDKVGPWAGIAVLLTEKRRSGQAIKPLYFQAQYKYSTLAPVNDGVRKELESKNSQDVLYDRRKTYSTAQNGKQAVAP